MNEENKPKKNNPDAEIDDALQRGEKAIAARKNIVEKNKPANKNDKEEQADAEKWHNEG